MPWAFADHALFELALGHRPDRGCRGGWLRRDSKCRRCCSPGDGAARIGGFVAHACAAASAVPQSRALPPHVPLPSHTSETVQYKPSLQPVPAVLLVQALTARSGLHVWHGIAGLSASAVTHMPSITQPEVRATLQRSLMSSHNSVVQPRPSLQSRAAAEADAQPIAAVVGRAPEAVVAGGAQRLVAPEQRRERWIAFLAEVQWIRHACADTLVEDHATAAQRGAAQSRDSLQTSSVQLCHRRNRARWWCNFPEPSHWSLIVQNKLSLQAMPAVLFVQLVGETPGLQL